MKAKRGSGSGHGVVKTLGGSAWLLLIVLACARTKPSPPAQSAERAIPPASGKVTALEPTPLENAEARFDASEYRESERLYRAIMEREVDRSSKEFGQASLGLAKVLLTTGRYAEAVRTAQVAREADSKAPALAIAIEAEALRRRGQLDPARALLEQALAQGDDFRLRISLAEILLEVGDRFEAKQRLLGIIEAYNDGAIATTDARAMGLVGRAAELLRSPGDANDAYIAAEEGSKRPDRELLLWRANMFLDKYDTGHAEEIFREILAHAPHEPDALVGLARVKLAQTMDFESAEQLATQALATNPVHSGASFVLASVLLRDLELGRVDSVLARGLEANPRDLELLSLRATARFLADDDEGFRRVESSVLGFNRQYSRFYDIVGEYADWEHRYDAIVELMRKAVAVDDADAAALAGLGLNLIRVGDDSGGLVALKRAFTKDPFNVRVFNTLNLYDQVIATDYLDERNSRFRFRYGKSEAALLGRYVPQLVDAAWNKMVSYYGFTPKGPVGIELYEKREHFAVRTSGLPNIGIQGVCFGKTLAVITPKREPINLGMTLWHELSHVFHIQLSKSHVPRWFTEGLAEYETSVERPEWHRERAAELYQALRNQTLPPVAQMNRAFSHAETMEDMATAYAASAQIVTMLAERHGRSKLRKMLVLWGEGKTTAEVLRAALGMSAEEIDAQFREYLRHRLQRYDAELVPLTRAGDPARLRAQIKETPNDPSLRLRLAASFLEAGDVARAKPLVEAIAHEEPSDIEAQFLLARVALAARDLETAERTVKALIAAGHRGYALQILLAEIYGAAERDAELTAALLEAHRLDPDEAEPILGLWQDARRRNDPSAELGWLRKLARLEPHAADVYQRLLELLLDQKAYEEAVSFGESALYADLEGARTHLLFARALAATGRLDRADHEFESATLCPEPPEVTASASVEYAKFLSLRGRRDKAKRQLERALELDPKGASAESLGL